MRKPLIGLLGVVALVSIPAVAEAASPGLNGKIAFSQYNPNASAEDVWVMQPDGTGQTAIPVPGSEQNPAWSPDGAKIAFVSNADIHVMNADGSGVVNLTPGTFSTETSPTWSPDGSQIAFGSSREAAFGFKIFKMYADGSDVTRITDGVLADSEPDWSPDGLRIAFVRDGSIYTIRPDGGDLQIVISSSRSLRQVDWSPSGHRIVYQHPGSSPSTTGIHTVEPDGSNDVDLTSFLTEAHEPVWSPDGTKILAKKGLHLWTMGPDGSGAAQLTTTTSNYFAPDWQPLPYPGYPRPKGATPLRVPLVPAYATCAAPNRTHGPPLGFPSCNPPAQTSPNLTVGTPDAGGGAASSTGFFRIIAKVGTPGPPDDSGAEINVSLTDVRCNAALPTCGAANAIGGADYVGELEVEVEVRMTDKFNGTVGPTYAEPGTVEDFTFRFSTSACAGTASTAEGSSCTINTDVLYVIPGVAKDGKRQIWELGQVRVLDGGPDGDADTPDNSVFAVQGLFVP